MVKRNFAKENEEFDYTLYNSSIVCKDPFKNNEGEYKRFAERIDLTQYAKVRTDGGISAVAVPQYGYEKDLQVQTVSLEISVTKRMRTTGKDDQISDIIDQLSTVCARTKEHDLALRLTFATATSYTDRNGISVDTTVGDSLALLSTVHTLKGSATTYSSRVTGNPAFSKTALELAERTRVENSYNNLGEKKPLMLDTIITTDDPTTNNQIRELLGASSDVSSNNSNTINVYKSKYTVIKSQLIATTAAGAVDSTKRAYWFLASSKASSFKIADLDMPYLKTPMDGNNGEEFSSENWKYLAAASYGIAIVDARWIIGSTGDGA